jgi:hypothetical protein
MQVHHAFRRILACSVAIVAGLSLASAAQATVVLDQNNPPPGGGYMNDSLEWQQQVTAGATGTLAGITLYGFGSSDQVSIAMGPAFNSGPFVFSQTVTLNNAGAFIDTSAANIHLTPGTTFTIDVTGGDGCCFLLGSNVAYPGGHVFLNAGGSVFDYTQLIGISMAFQTYVDQTPVSSAPEPATWAMLLVGFGGAGAALRRRSRLKLA